MLVNLIRSIALISAIKLLSVKSFRLTTIGRDLHVKVNEVVQLKCTVEGSDYNPFSNVMTWTKYQRGQYWTTRLVTQFEDLHEPFKTSGRYNAKISTPGTRHELLLTINKTRYEDSGTYKCKVGNFEVNMTLYIIAEMKSLSIYGSSKSSDKWRDLQPATDQLRYDGSVPGMIQCVAHGGYPPAAISITVDNLQKTGHFNNYDRYCNLTGKMVGLQVPDCVSWRGRNDYTPSSVVNGKIFKCKAHVHDFVLDKTTSITLLINGVPVYIENKCPNIVYARPGDKNIELVCLISSFPSPSQISWRVDTSGVDVTSNKSKLAPNSQEIKFSAFNMFQLNGTIEAKLNIREVKEADFKTYILNVANEKGEMEPRQIELKKGSRTGSSTLAASSMSVSPLLLVVLLLSTTLMCTGIS